MALLLIFTFLGSIEVLAVVVGAVLWLVGVLSKQPGVRKVGAVVTGAALAALLVTFLLYVLAAVLLPEGQAGQTIPSS